MPDIPTKLDRVRRLKRSLESLAVIYEKAVLEAGEERIELRLSARQLTNCSDENVPTPETIHVIEGESLKATHEVWQEYGRIERELVERSKAAMCARKSGDNIVKFPVPIRAPAAEKQEDMNKPEQHPAGLDYLSDLERTWLVWYYALPEDEKELVELCGEKGIAVTPENFDVMKKALA